MRVQVQTTFMNLLWRSNAQYDVRVQVEENVISAY